MKPFIYLHMPKNAGNTIKRILAYQYNKKLIRINPAFTYYDLINLSNRGKGKINYLYGGHIPFGLHGLFSKKMKYITLLRDPVERMISSYRYICLNKRGGFYKNIPKIERQNLESFIRNIDKYTLTHGNNAQVRLLAGVQMDADFNLISNKVEVCDEVLLEIALKNIEEHFEFCGVVELFDESLVLIKKHLGWRKPLYFKKYNVTTQNELKIDNSIIKLIEDMNSLDIKLYNILKDKLKIEIEKNQNHIDKELKKMTLNNFIYKNYSNFKARLKNIFIKKHSFDNL